jgi:hypothetical protein
VDRGLESEHRGDSGDRNKHATYRLTTLRREVDRDGQA